VDYRKRIVDDELAQRLRVAGVVVLEGPKAVGKTATALEKAQSDVRLDTDANARLAADVEPTLILEGATPRLIDEWQVVPGIWNAAREEADRRGAKGQFILTGSAVPADDVTRHTGAGRVSRVRLRPMTLFETGISSGQVSLQRLLSGEHAHAPDSGITVRTLADLMCRGGWPSLQTLEVSDAAVWLADYLEEVSRTDIRRVDGIARDPVKVRHVLRSLARNVATEAAITSIAADAGGPDGPMRSNTVSEYLTALERLMLVENQEAWAPHLRSRSRLRNAPKRHFIDPSLALAALGMLPAALLGDFNFMGLVFESLVIRDLRVYVQPNRGNVLHYRDNTGVEVDAILEMPDQTWAAIEVKLGSAQIDAAAESLQRFLGRVDLEKCGAPAFLGVVVPIGPAYTRNDGIHVMPIGTLAP
jgi:predicted AAA+ superfamily ATPase